ncbi:MAG TPA: pyridoxamine 5'-phosphate oxidase family protein [Candidatus Limnocylindria bacterium]|nr:pyridoxamine 5'-phosphate oxidase family protein [Candidatus Limnocylindria bacterium]
MNHTDKKLILDFIKSNKIAVISTNSETGWPQGAVIEFAETEELEIVFDTSVAYRKYKNLSKDKKTSFVIGWDKQITVQYEGLAEELMDAEEINAYKAIYFKKNPDAQRWESDPEIRYFIVKPKWLRYSDLNVKPWKIIELNF